MPTEQEVTMSSSEPVFACDLGAMTAAERERLARSCRDIFAAAKEVKIFDDGYAVGFENPSAQLLAAMSDFIAVDRLCCPFVRHGLIVEPFGGTTWLQLTGGHGVKEAIAGDLIRMLPAAVASAAGLGGAAL
jgi:hypothetical protein